MNRGSATRTIVGTRLRKESRLIVTACASAALVAFLQPHELPPSALPAHAEATTRTLWIAGPLFFGTLLGIVVALLQRGAGRLRELELCEQSAPLFGRELARATALVPCIIVTLALGVYWLVQWLTGFAAPPTFFALALAGVIASTIVALSATLRRSANRYLYIAVACAVSAIELVLAVYADGVWSIIPKAPAQRGDLLSVASVVIFAAITGFVALRQYGEALARYDPIPNSPGALAEAEGTA